MNGLYREKRYADCLELYKEQKQAHPESKLLQDKMGWCVYQVCLLKHDFRKGNHLRYFQQVDYVLKVCGNGSYSPVVHIVCHAVDGILSSKNRQEYIRAKAYLDSLRPEELSTQERSFDVRNGRHVVTASDQEKWFALKTKLLWEMERYEDCIACCEQGLALVKKFYNNEDVWLGQRKARRLQKIGNIAAAEAESVVLLRGNICHWAILQFAFELAVQRGGDGCSTEIFGECGVDGSQSRYAGKLLCAGGGVSV